MKCVMLVNRACTATDLKKTTRQRSLKNEDKQNQLWGSHVNVLDVIQIQKASLIPKRRLPL